MNVEGKKLSRSVRYYFFMSGSNIIHKNLIRNIDWTMQKKDQNQNYVLKITIFGTSTPCTLNHFLCVCYTVLIINTKGVCL
ncbi:hypothetical protein BCR22_09940 [Enterococcus plantarum]|nr:hypothetical protein BCR22_09940 [Enterococcus plantarum]